METEAQAELLSSGVGPCPASTAPEGGHLLGSKEAQGQGRENAGYSEFESLRGSGRLVDIGPEVVTTVTKCRGL